MENVCEKYLITGPLNFVIVVCSDRGEPGPLAPHLNPRLATASMDCLPVVEGVLPMELYLEKRIYFYRIWRDLSSVIGENIRAKDYQDPDGRTRFLQ